MFDQPNNVAVTQDVDEPETEPAPVERFVSLPFTFLIDNSRDVVLRKSASPLVSGQLITPLTRYKNWGGVYAIDNGAFSGFDAVAFDSILEREKSGGNKDECLFVVVPDIIGSGRRTLEIWNQRWIWKWSHQWPLAFVAQDGVEDLEIPWAEMRAVFIGGRDPWKDSQSAADVVKTAKTLGVHVHVGRVNTPKRYEHFAGLGADTCDGSGVAMYDHMLAKIEKRMNGEGDPTLFDLSGMDASP